MRTINCNKRQQVVRASSKLLDDFRESASVLFALFSPIKSERASGIVDKQVIDPTNCNKLVENNRRTFTSFSTVIEIWHEMENWDLLKTRQESDDYSI